MHILVRIADNPTHLYFSLYPSVGDRRGSLLSVLGEMEDGRLIMEKNNCDQTNKATNITLNYLHRMLSYQVQE